MILMTVLSLIAAAVAVVILMVASDANGRASWRCSRRPRCHRCGPRLMLAERAISLRL